MAELGTDISCVSDLDPSMPTVSGRLALAQAVARRITTQPGSLFYDLDYGYDLRGLIGVELTNTALEAAKIEREIMKDARVENVSVEITLLNLERVTVAVRLVTADGPFDLTVDVSEAGVALGLT